MPQSFKFSEQGDAQWFSPKHAGDKFKEITLRLAALGMRLERKKAIANEVWAIEELAETYARYYLTQSPVQSVRVMQPSGAIYVILADGREVLVPQAPAHD